MRNVLIISKSPLNRDPRVYKQILFLKEAKGFNIVTAGTAPSGIEDDFFQMPGETSIWKHFSLALLLQKLAGDEQQFSFLASLRQAWQLKSGPYEAHYWSEYRIRKTYERFADSTPRFDLIIANDIPALPLAQRLAAKHKARLYLDAHEYEPRRHDTSGFNSCLEDYWYKICEDYLPSVDYMTTVSEGIAQEYTKNFKVQCEVMMNLPFYSDMAPVNRLDGKIRMIHHGAAAALRGIHRMIELMRYLDSRFELDFMMLGMNSAYGQRLKSMASAESRIRFLEPVGMPEIVRTICMYDIGLYLLAPNTFNHKMGLPNKLFEFIQARLAVAIWPSPEMVKIVEKYNNGVYSRNFDLSEMAAVLNRLTDKEVERMKNNSHLAAQEFNSEKTRRQFLSIVNTLVGR